MKIFIIGTDNGTYPGFAYQCQMACKDLGHQTCYLSYRMLKLHKTSWSNSFLNRYIERKVTAANPDILIVNKGESLLPGTIRRITRQGIKTVNWTLDEPFGTYYPKNRISNITEYDHFFVFDPGYVDDLKEIGSQAHYLPCAADPKYVHKEQIPIQKREWKNNLSFVGSHEQKREQILRQLQEFGPHVYGYRWHSICSSTLPNIHKEIPRGDRMCNIFNCSKINLNIHARHSLRSVNLRTFEVPSSKSFLLTEYFDEMPNLFALGKEAVCYENLVDLKEKIRYYLDNEDERISIANKGQQRVVEEHTVKHRISKIISTTR